MEDNGVEMRGWLAEVECVLPVQVRSVSLLWTLPIQTV